MQDILSPRKLPDPVKEELSKFHLNGCFICGTCTNGCPITHTPDMEGVGCQKSNQNAGPGLLDEGEWRPQTVTRILMKWNSKGGKP